MRFRFLQWPRGDFYAQLDETYWHLYPLTSNWFNVVLRCSHAHCQRRSFFDNYGFAIPVLVAFRLTFLVSVVVWLCRTQLVFEAPSVFSRSYIFVDGQVFSSVDASNRPGKRDVMRKLGADKVFCCSHCRPGLAFPQICVAGRTVSCVCTLPPIISYVADPLLF